MSTPAPTPATPAPQESKPVKKRSPVERALVWGAILLMLVVVGMEWKSQQGYTKTLNNLEDKISGGGPLNLPELQGYVSGYAVRTETTEKDERIVTLHWPSLFKNYKLIIPVDKSDLISSFETGEKLPVEPAAKSDAPTPTFSEEMTNAMAKDMQRPEGESDAKDKPKEDAAGDSKDAPAKDEPAKDVPEKDEKDAPAKDETKKD